MIFEPIPAVGAKGALVRNKIGACALDMFAVRGFEGTSTRAIADHIGIKHSALLYHFGSKKNLWFYVMEGALKHYRSALVQNMPADPLAHPEEALRAFINTAVDFGSCVPQFNKIMMMSNTQSSDRLSWLIEEHLRPHYELVIDLIVKLQESGKVWPVDPIRLYYSIIGICGTMFSASIEIGSLSKTDVFLPEEIERTKEFLSTFVFTSGPKFRIRVKQPELG